MTKPPLAPLIAKIPPSRFTSLDGTKPQIGDIVQLDQGFTFPDGEPGCLVYLVAQDGSYRYGAEVYESEIGPDFLA
jgi:hypothetical protein